MPVNLRNYSVYAKITDFLFMKNFAGPSSKNIFELNGKHMNIVTIKT